MRFLSFFTKWVGVCGFCFFFPSFRLNVVFVILKRFLFSDIEGIRGLVVEMGLMITYNLFIKPPFSKKKAVAGHVPLSLSKKNN